MTTDTLVSTLPKGDIMLLEKGLEVKEKKISKIAGGLLQLKMI